MLKDKSNTEHYFWGSECEGWCILKDDRLRVIEEEMPPFTQEKLHYHQKAQQVFYIKEGTAKFIIDNEIIIAKANQSVLIKPTSKHQIINEENTPLKFLVISQPATSGDRFEL